MSKIFNLSVTLNNGVRMPVLGLGTFQSKGLDAYKAVLYSLKEGYRHIDTAGGYNNEDQVGKAIRDSGIDRKEIFVTSKLRPVDQGYDKAREACLKSLNALGLSYLDLYLIHWPGVQGLPTNSKENAILRKESWEALESLCLEGKCRAIGVSNYTIPHLKQLLSHCKIAPAVNQVELHPELQQRDLIEFSKQNGIVVEAYSSLGQGHLLGNPKVLELSKSKNKTPSQILLRWGLEKNLVVIPKSINPNRIIENANIFDWKLDTDDIKILDTLERDHHYCWNPATVV
eukprot:TRINITY_DN2222_c0_g1_i1.p1 TRINITY_DN2222_c0_g1~~TRINITY_DN2222_c0_g1_i1.p1  ORF type:complete len:286 (+),score=46.97 TRINITY_DN2222_c0_g1_i1:52-909(+)